MPRAKRPAGTTVDKRNGQRVGLAVVAGQRFDLPEDVAEGLLPQTVDAWDAYWSDPVAGVHTPADRAALLSWIEALDRHTRLLRAADQQPLVDTSQGVTRNPLYAVAEGVWKTIAELQAQLGIGPKNRVALGIAVIQEQRSLADVNARYGGGDGGKDGDAAPRLDPRVIDATS
jgi:P27 family predicted phage terminase small subunit